MTKAARIGDHRTRRWVAAGILGSIVLVSLVQWKRYENARDRDGATGLSAPALSAPAIFPLDTAWRRIRRLPPFGRERSEPAKPILKMTSNSGRQSGLDVIGGVVGGVAGNAPPPLPQGGVAGERPESTERMMVRTGRLQIIAADPLRVAEQLRDLAGQLSGFVVSSSVNGNEQGAQTAQVLVRIPAKSFDEARRRIRSLAKTVEQDSIEARDVTREHVDQEANLRNARAEEAQYLAILRRAVKIEDVLEVTGKLTETRAGIDRTEAELKVLDQEVEMSLLTTDVRGVARAPELGTSWQPVYEAKSALREALTGWTVYANAMMGLLLNLPVVVAWGFTIVLVVKAGWMMLRRIVVLFFPGMVRRRIGEQVA